MAKKKVLVTGGSGFVGRAIIDRVLANDYDVVAIARRTNMPAHLKRDGIDVKIGDVRDKDFIDEITKDVDYIIHAAATMQGAWEDFYKINVEATEFLLDATVKNIVKRFIYVSSASIYQHYSMTPGGQVFTEDMPYEEETHTSYYSRSKIEAEKVVLKYVEEHNVYAVIFRPGAVFGPAGNIFPATTGLGLGISKIIGMGDLNTDLPLSYVENVADALVQALVKPKIKGESYNLVEDQTLTRQAYLDRLKAEANTMLKVIKAPKWLMETMKTILKRTFGLIGKKAPLSELNLDLYCTSIKYSNEKCKAAFGEKPFVGFEESIDRTMKWFKQTLTPKRASGIMGKNVVVPSGRKLNVGLIGCGNIANVHMMFLKKFDRVHEICIADPQSEALEQFKKKYGVTKAYTDYKEMLANEKLDVVHILAPPQFHTEIAIEAAKTGVHILAEKPIALDAKQAQKMTKAVEENNIKFCMVHNHLYDEVMLKAREVVAHGLLGRITYVESWYGTQFGNFAPPFEPDKYWGYSMPGSLYQDYLPHAMYVFLDMMGKDVKVKNVFANYIGGVPGVDTDELKIICENGSKMGMISVSFSVAPRYQFMNVYGTAGTMKIDFLNKTVYVDKEIGGVPKTINRAISAFKYSTTLGMAAIKNTFKMFKVQQNLFEGTNRIIRLFYRSIVLEEQEPVPFKEGLEVMQLMDDVWAKIDKKEEQQGA